jgi:hypothetical protein
MHFEDGARKPLKETDAGLNSQASLSNTKANLQAADLVNVPQAEPALLFLFGNVIPRVVVPHEPDIFNMIGILVHHREVCFDRIVAR